MRTAHISVCFSCLLALPLTLAAQPATSAAPAQELHCTIPPARATSADTALAQGKPALAEELFTAQLTTAPTIATYSGIVDSQLDQNHLPDALASAQRAKAALPASADAQALVGDVLLRSGQIPEASTAYNQAISLDRCSSRAHAGIARLYDLVGRHATAYREFSFAHRLAPRDPVITAAYLQALPPPQRAAPLSAFLATHPLLPADQLETLNTQLAVLEQHKSCTASSAFTTARLDLQPILINGRYTRSWGLKTSMNNNTLPLLELDTTVSGIVLNPDDANKAGVHPLDGVKARLTGTSTAVADHIRIGNLDFTDCPVTVVPASYLAGGNSLIGSDFFRDHLIHIDYVAHLVTLNPLPALTPGPLGLTDSTPSSAAKDWVPVYVSGPTVLLPTLINKKGPFLFAMDTGIGRSIYSPAVTRAQLSDSTDATLNLIGSSTSFVKVVPRDGGGETNITDVHGPDGTLLKVTRPVKLPVLRYALSEIPDPTAVSFDLSPLSHQVNTEVSGLLGFALLSYFDIEINYRDSLARVAFDQNRRYHVQQNDLHDFASGAGVVY